MRVKNDEKHPVVVVLEVAVAAMTLYAVWLQTAGTDANRRPLAASYWLMVGDLSRSVAHRAGSIALHAEDRYYQSVN